MKPQSDPSHASAAWSIPEIRVVKDDQGRLRIDPSDPATYGAYAARQLLATAQADPKFRDGMTKRPSTPSIRITYDDGSGKRQAIGVREIFCQMQGDALVLTKFETADGEKLKDLPIPAPVVDDPDDDLDDMDRLHQLALAELDDEPPSKPAQIEREPEPEPARPEPPRERRLPTGPLRQYDEAASKPSPPSGALKPPPTPEPATRGPAVEKKAAAAPAKPPATSTLRSLDDNEAAALRALIEAKAGEARWASGLLIQAAERQPSDRRLQNEYLATLLRVSLDPMRAESRTPLGGALRGIIEEVHAYKAGVLDRDPLKAEKSALQPFARLALAPPPTDDDQPIKVVSGTAQRTPAQVLAKLEDPKLARATRVRFLLEIVPELIETWRPDKESGNSEAANESSPAVVRRLFAVANEQRQQRKYIDDGASFRKAGERYKGLETKLPKPSITDNS